MNRLDSLLVVAYNQDAMTRRLFFAAPVINFLPFRESQLSKTKKMVKMKIEKTLRDIIIRHPQNPNLFWHTELEYFMTQIFSLCHLDAVVIPALICDNPIKNATGTVKFSYKGTWHTVIASVGEKDRVNLTFWGK